MKTKLLLLFATALSLPLFTACSSDDDAGNPDNGKPTVKFTANISTRTLLGSDSQIRWSNTDVVSINGSASTNTMLSEEGAVATFTAAATPDYYVFYPASMVNENGYDATAHTYAITFPAAQTYKDDVSFSDATNPAVAVSVNTYLTFNNVCGMLRMPINTNMAATKARLVCNESIAGAATVNPANKTLTITGTGKTLDLTSLPTSKATYTLNWVLPVGTYTPGWKIQLLDAADNILSERVGTNALTIERSKITNATMPDASAVAFRYGIPVGKVYWAKGNLYMPTTTTYAFAATQETYGNTYGSGYYFPFNCLNSRTLASNNTNTTSWVVADDPCAKIVPAGKWRVPTEAELVALYANGSVWGQKGDKVGRYFGTTTAPTTGMEDNFIFLPAAGRRDRSVETIICLSKDSEQGFYMSQSFISGQYRYLEFKSTSIMPNTAGYRDRGESIRCVSDE